LTQSLRDVVAQHLGQYQDDITGRWYSIEVSDEDRMKAALATAERVDELSIAVGKLVQATQLLLDTLSRVPQGDANGTL
jgi:hypothetical protein